MMSMQLSRAAQVLGVSHSGVDVEFHGISTDTRSLREGNLFVALQGPNFDGHAYLRQALGRSAVAAVVSQAVAIDLPQLQVADTRLALGELAAHWRRRFAVPLLAVTGSNGKTTVKEMLAAILRRSGPTLVTQGNLNNDIGVPHTLFGLCAEHACAVIELGANHPGEIGYLTGLVRPTVAVVNNAGPAHLEGFGSLEGVARAKGELFATAPDDAVCVINADDVYAGVWQQLAAPRRVLTFGLDSAADIGAQWSGDATGSELVLQAGRATTTVRIPLPGRHNVMNALAATAAATAMGVSLDQIAAGLAEVQPAHGRWQVQSGLGGSRLIDDTYNANPASLQAGLDVLSTQQGEHWLVLGDMGELGVAGDGLHRRVGELARSSGVTRLYALGELAGLAAQAFGAGGESCTDINELKTLLRQQVHEGVTVLVKGSRAMRMERVVQALRANGGGH
jgi:UDP-N-acetylmuramoyl-tripeptide--D-alanyl-D-alanine ligase